MSNIAAPLRQAPLITPICLSCGPTCTPDRMISQRHLHLAIALLGGPCWPTSSNLTSSAINSCHSPPPFRSRSHVPVPDSPLQPSIMPVSELSQDLPRSEPTNNPFPIQNSPLLHLCQFMPCILKSLASCPPFQPPRSPVRHPARITVFCVPWVLSSQPGPWVTHSHAEHSASEDISGVETLSLLP